MFFKIFKKTFLLFLLSFISIPINILAYSDYIIAGGESVGIHLNSKGVMVVGLYKVNATYPAVDAGIKVGDVVTSINDQSISNINELAEKINSSSRMGNVKIGYIRNSITNYTNLKLYKDENSVYKTGLYVKDSITGVGTLTFIDPKTKIFGALGHEIIEKSTGRLLEIKDGKIYNSSVTGIEPSSEGVPGEKNAKFFVDEINGTVYENTKQGIFGNFTKEISDKKLYKVAKYNDIKKGEAQILTVTKGTTIDTYNINIIKVSNDDKIKNILFEITDERLLKITNGIVQGMSGSPIIQGEYIIGAVTHVVVDAPQRGYGILITNMLEEAEN